MKILLIYLMPLLLLSCINESQERYTQNAPEIDTFKESIKEYENQNWEAFKTHYADTAKIFNNSTEKNPKSIDETIKEYQKNSEIFISWGFLKDTEEFEMVVTDRGQTWVNYWAVWQGRLAATNELFEVPCHVTVQFVDGKIVREHGYWDNAPIVLALRELNVEEPAKK
jgi:hypothetical protein